MQDREIIRSYIKGSSINEIAASFSLSTRKVRDALAYNNIKLRDHKEAAYIKSNRLGDPFDILTQLTPEEEHLKAMALGLYLTEGNTKNKNSVRFTNSNPALVKIFVKFLKAVCGVESDKIKLTLSYEGLKGRELSVANRLRLFPTNRKCGEDEYKKDLELKVTDVMSKLKDHVYQIAIGLFGLFDFLSLTEL